MKDKELKVLTKVVDLFSVATSELSVLENDEFSRVMDYLKNRYGFMGFMGMDAFKADL